METAGFDINILYTTINLLLLVAAIVTGNNITAGVSYGKNAFGFTVIYSIVLGLRYNRGNDYLHYIDVYLYDLEDKQVVFTWFNQFFRFWDVSPYLMFTLYAAVLCICFFIFLSDYKSYAKWMVPFFLISFIWFEEFVIRQCFSWSFVFVLLKLLNLLSNYQERQEKSISYKSKIYAGLIIVSFIIYGTHSANIFVVIVVFFFYTTNKIIPWKFSIPIFIFATYFFSSFFKGNFISEYLMLLQGVDSKLDAYANEGDKWFDTTGGDTDKVRGGVVKILETWGTVALIYYGHKLYEIHNNRLYVLMYNSFVFGTIFRHAFFHLEILNRLGLILEIFWFVPISFLPYDANKLCLTNRFNLRFMLGLSWFVVEYIKYIAFRSANRMQFLWDI